MWNRFFVVMVNGQVCSLTIMEHLQLHCSDFVRLEGRKSLGRVACTSVPWGLGVDRNGRIFSSRKILVGNFLLETPVFSVYSSVHFC